MLPPAFTSLYRLVLRACSTAVLHHYAAKKNLRLLYRPVFDDAAKRIKLLQQNPEPKVRAELENWLKIWNERMDNTLALLHSSSRSRGLPHKVTRNLTLMMWGKYNALAFQSLTRWNPQVAGGPGSSIYKASPPSSRAAQLAAMKEEVDDRAWNALGQVIRMAEGQAGIALGRARIRAKVKSR